MFQTANYIEAGLWGLIGVSFIVYAVLPRTTNRGMALLTGATFLAFGLSDVVETRTGAWWRPWWLLAWKGICIAIFLALLIRHFTTKLTRNTSPPSSATSSDRPAEA